MKGRHVYLDGDALERLEKYKRKYNAKSYSKTILELTRELETLQRIVMAQQAGPLSSLNKRATSKRAVKFLNLAEESEIYNV